MKLQHRQEKIQAKRKQTSWRDFVMEIASWTPLNIYRRKEKLLSRYPDNRMQNVISNKELGHIDPMDYGNEYSGIFSSDFTKLFSYIPQGALLSQGVNENADFVDCAMGCKDSYLSFVIGNESKNIVYTALCYMSCIDIYNSIMVTNGCNIVYNSLCITNSYNIFYNRYISDSDNIWFSTNLIGCSECLLCNDLQNQSYCIDNIQYSKEEYVLEKQRILTAKEKYCEYFEKVLSNIGINLSSENVNGVYIAKSNNIKNGLRISNMHDGNNIILGDGVNGSSHIYDGLDIGSNSNNFYGVNGAGRLSENLYCCNQVIKSQNIYYSYNIEDCSFCLGCIGLKNKSYCILNKQYTKEERYEKVDEIFTQMEKDGHLGEFFPASMNPFYFNDTAAYLIDNSFTKEEVTAKGYLRRDEPIKVDIPEGMEVVYSHKVEGQKSLEDFEGFDDQGNWTINADILKCVIQDEQGNVYRIIPMEYKFLVKHGLPLPRKHWLERMKENFRIN